MSSSKTNFHSHTNFSDGSSSPEEYVIAAIDAGFSDYGFSDHAPMDFPSHFLMKQGRFDEYKTEVERLKEKYAGQINIFLSMEVDFIPEINSPADWASELDYTVGSVHFIDAIDGVPWGFERPGKLFARGFDLLFSNDRRAVVERYVDLQIQMIEEGKPDILGHCDKIKMHQETFPLFEWTENWAQKAFARLLDAVEASRTIIELNTRGFYQETTPDFYPNDYLLKEMVRREMPVVLSSDAHRPKEIDLGFVTARDLLAKYGVQIMDRPRCLEEMLSA